MKRNISIKFILSLILIAGYIIPNPVFGTGYYVDCSASIDGNGSLDSPWNNIDTVNNHVPFLPGDTIYLKKGTTCFGELWPKGSGDSTAQIVLCSYGPDSAAKPVIDAQGGLCAAIKLYNQEYWTIQDLEVTNNATEFGARYGILIKNDDGTVCHGFRILNNTVRNVYASLAWNTVEDVPGFHRVGGIYIWVVEPGHADGVLIQENELYDIVGTGLVFWGESELTGGGMNWDNLSPGVVVRRNTVMRTAGDGILILGTDNELSEYNVVLYAGVLGDMSTKYMAGLWPTRHRNGLWQFNEVGYTIKWVDDGQGFDNDLYLQGTTIFQYNYSHDNEGGFFLDCCGPDGGKSVLRYNISVNEPCGRLDRGNAEFYNNTFYNPGNVFSINNTSGNKFYNNIFWCVGLGGNTNQIFSHNLYYGGVSAPSSDANAITADPNFINPGSDTLDGYKFRFGSPCIGNGLLISNNGGRDFWGNTVSDTGSPNRGAYGETGLSPVQPIGLLLPDTVSVVINGSLSLTAYNVLEDSGKILHSDTGLVWTIDSVGLLTMDTPGVITAGSDTGWVTVMCSSVVTGYTDSGLVHIIPFLNELHVTNGTGGTERIDFSGYGRYVVLLGLQRSTIYGYSLFEFQVYSGGNNVALNKTVTVTSIESSVFTGEQAVDGNFTTRWASLYSDPQEIGIDLEHDMQIDSIILYWEAAYATEYNINVLFDSTVTSNQIRSQTPELYGFETFPNPFNPSTKISYKLPLAQPVELAVFDVSGRLIRLLVSKEEKAGTHSVEWNGCDQQNWLMSSGVYLIKLKTGNKEIVRRVVLIR